MKKFINTFIVLVAIMSLMTAVGCSNNNNVKKHNIDSNNLNSIDDNDTLVDTKTYDDKDNSLLIVFKRYTNNRKTYATIKGYEKKDKEVWSYSTSRTDDETISPYELLDGEEDKVIIKENNNIVILNTKDGKTISRIDNVGSSLVYIGKVRNLNDLENTNDYYIIGKKSDMDGLTNLIAIDCNTYKIAKDVKLPEDYSTYEYKMKVVDGAPTDIYLEFSKYTVKLDADNTTGFMVTDIFKNDFKAKTIEISFED